MFGDILQITLTLVFAYLVIANADKFAIAVGAAGKTYVDAIKALQGR